MDIQEIKEDLFKKSMTRHNVLDLSVGLFTLLFHEFIAKPYYITELIFMPMTYTIFTLQIPSEIHWVRLQAYS